MKEPFISLRKEPWRLRAPAFAVADNLYYIGNRNVSCHLLNTEAGLVLIDTAFARTTYLLTESIRSLGMNPSGIELILLTHGHVDHCGAARRIKELSGAVIALGEKDVKTVERGSALTCAEYAYGIIEFETFKVDRVLGHGEVIDFGGTAIRCHHTPGHTPGVMSFTFEVTVNGKRRTAGIFGGPGLWTLEDKHRAEQGYAENRKDMAESLKYLKTLSVEVWLGAHPGLNRTFEKHELSKTGKTLNPFVDPAGWKRSLEEIELNLKRLCEERRK